MGLRFALGLTSSKADSVDLFMNSDIQPSLNFSLNLRSKEQWSLSKKKIDCLDLKIHPAKYVVLSHTVTPMCKHPISCQTTLINIQSDHIRKAYCDIGYNFLIGGDGYIYEGLGWGKYGAHTYGFNCDSIGIAFIGNFNVDHPTKRMIELFNQIIEEGLRLNQLTSDYKLISQKQVLSFASPGIYIEELMTEWDHFSLVALNDYLCS
ncbi:Putative peptidoglycan-recognition protein [Halyomorpha halys]|nr:Putative peptidoglycan-recognition protein [Halyomorpha halys]